MSNDTLEQSRERKHTEGRVASDRESLATEDEESGLLDVAVVVVDNLKLLVLGPLAAGIVALGVAFLLTPIFTAQTAFLPPQQQQSAASAALAQLGTLAGIAASAAGVKSPSEQYVALLKSTTVADRLVDRFDLARLYATKFRQDARTILGSKTRVSAGKDGLIVVTVDDESPQRAADIANAYVSELQVLLGALALTEAQQRRAFFEKQLEKTKDSLTKAELALGAIGVSTSAIKANPEAAVEAVARLQAEITSQEVKLAAMRGYLTESAPELKRAQTELAALRSQLRRSESSEPTASSVGGYIEKYRDFKYQETLFELFARQFELAKLDEAREGALIQVVDPALPPERKSRPKRALIAILTALTAVMMLLAWVFGRNVIARTAARPEEASKLAVIRQGISQLFMSRRKER